MGGKSCKMVETENSVIIYKYSLSIIQYSYLYSPRIRVQISWSE